MERQAWKLIVLLLLFCYVHSPYVKAQVGNGKQITMEFKNEGLPSIFKRLQKLSGYKVLFIYDEVRSYHSTGKVEKYFIIWVYAVPCFICWSSRLPMKMDRNGRCPKGCI